MSNRKFQMDRFLHGKNHHKRRTNRNRPTPRTFRQNVGDDSGYLTVNLHDLALHNAKNRIKEELRDAKADLKRGVRFIHGFNGGTAIRDWMRGDSLKQFMQSAKISGTIWFTQEGVTCISLDMINLGRDEN
jgi:hypothetical protein